MQGYFIIKMKIHCLLTMIAIPIVLPLQPCNYCAIPTCVVPNSHTLCIHQHGELAWERCVNLVRLTLLPTEKNTIVNLHNYFRERVFHGNESRGNPGPQPAAANVGLVEWDEELARAAYIWAQQCPSEVDECRDVLRFRVHQSVGTNQTRGNVSELSIEGMLWSWYNQVKDFDATEVSSYSAESANLRSTHQYTQIVWGNTQRIGCARITYYNGVIYTMTLVCNYGPAGNQEGEPVYIIGNVEN